MTRFLLALLLALSLVGGPVAAAAASAAVTPKTACSMPGEQPAQPVQQDKMGCCTHDCAMFTAVGLLPPGEVGHRLVAAGPALRLLTSTPALASLAPSTVDPPPRAA